MDISTFLIGKRNLKQYQSCVTLNNITLEQLSVLEYNELVAIGSRESPSTFISLIKLIEMILKRLFPFVR